MNVRLQMSRLTQAQAMDLREAYLNQLPFAQDAFLEARMGGAEYHLLEARGQELGYCAHTGHTLLEFHLHPSSVYLAQSVFPRMVQQRGLDEALIKSFDHLMLACALDIARDVAVQGMLVRDYTPQSLPDLPRMSYSMRLARLNDLAAVLAVRQEAFTHRGRMESVIRSEEMLLFERGTSLIGFGILRPVVDGRRDVEVGIAVDVPFRGKGYAAFILRDLVQHCLANGHNPVMGCAIDNTASISLGQRIGLCARHRLLRVSFSS
jgi:RimJ/RimL family protein N-acetyltransferase